MGSGSAAVVGAIIALVVARYTNRTIAGIYVLLLSCVGVIMMFAINPANYGARYGGYILTTQCKKSYRVLCWKLANSILL